MNSGGATGAVDSRGEVTGRENSYSSLSLSYGEIPSRSDSSNSASLSALLHESSICYKRNKVVVCLLVTLIFVLSVTAIALSVVVFNKFDDPISSVHLLVLRSPPYSIQLKGRPSQQCDVQKRSSNSSTAIAHRRNEKRTATGREHMSERRCAAMGRYWHRKMSEQEQQPDYSQYDEDSIPPNIEKPEIKHTHPGRPDLDYDDMPVGHHESTEHGHTVSANPCIYYLNANIIDC
ncbi:hypothetical protein Tcan_18428 [Toxocara canis]|uniref:Uncharacterized protein n=1 Tax=Toxocara canis TaxID=6265 RepID=A0A0B2VRH4_TOXCA|nr:hypothetical protein Tcan_18428 [Toxocara canis]